MTALDTADETRETAARALARAAAATIRGVET
jgi:hypothetical protein